MSATAKPLVSFIMFIVDLKKTQVWVTIAMLVLCFSIHRNSGYPHAQEDEDSMAAKDNLGDEEDLELAHYDDEASEEEHIILEEAPDVENAAGSGSSKSKLIHLSYT